MNKKKNRKEGQGRVVVFKQIKDRGKLFLAKNKLFSFLSFPGIINSFPQNGFSSMIYDIYCQSLISYFNVYLQNKDLHSYYSMSFSSTLTPTKVTVSKDISSECHLKNFEGYIRSFDYIRLCFRGSFNDVVSYDSAVLFLKSLDCHKYIGNVYMFNDLNEVVVNIKCEKKNSIELYEYFKGWEAYEGRVPIEKKLTFYYG